MLYKAKFFKEVPVSEFITYNGDMYYDWKAFLVLRKQDSTLKHSQCFIYKDDNTYYFCAIKEDFIHIYNILSNRYREVSNRKMDKNGIIPKGTSVKQAFKDCYCRDIWVG